MNGHTRMREEVSSTPPLSLDSILTTEGTNSVFRIFIQEYVKADHTDENALPGIKIGCGTYDCIDCIFHWHISQYETISNRRRPLNGTLDPFSHTPVTKSSSSLSPTITSSFSSPDDRRTLQVRMAREIYERFLVRPTAVSTPHEKHEYPPLHIRVTEDQVQQLRKSIETAETTLSNFPSTASTTATPSATSSVDLLLSPHLFQSFSDAAFIYLQDTFYELFLSDSLTCDHLETESLLLGPESIRKKFIKSAHNVYKEEYPLYYVAYEELRRELAHGPPLSTSDTDPSPPSDRSWHEVIFNRLDALSKMYLRENAEFAIFIEEEVRTAFHEALRTSRREWRLLPTLLTALVSIKDYCVEVMKCDVLPQYKEDLKRNHVNPRRASLLSNEAHSNALSSKSNSTIQSLGTVREDEIPLLIPVMKAPIAPPILSVTTPLQVVVDDDPSFWSSQSVESIAAGSHGRRKVSLIHAAVDVPLGVRRTSISNKAPTRSGHSEGTVSNGFTSDSSHAATSSSDARIADSGVDELQGISSSTRGPIPSSNPHLRSMAQLRSTRRSIISGTDGKLSGIVTAIDPSTTSQKLLPHFPPPPERILPTPTHKSPPAKPLSWDTDSEDEFEDETQDHTIRPHYSQAIAHPNEFRSFSLSAELLMKQQLPTDKHSTTSSLTVALTATATTNEVSGFTGLKRRSVVGSISTPASAMNRRSVIHSNSSPSRASYDPYRTVTFKSHLIDDVTASVPKSGHLASPPYSILKSKIRHETIHEVLKRIFHERVNEGQQYMPFLKSGSLIYKYDAQAKSTERYFQISEDGQELIWGKVDEKTKQPLKSGLFHRKKRMPIVDITYLHYGSSTSQRFSRYNSSPKSKPWMAWSIHFPDKTLDLLFRSEQESVSWFTGLQAIAPLSTTYLSKAAMTWKRAKMKIRYYSLWQNIDCALFIDDLLAAARQDVPKGCPLPPRPVVNLLDEQIAAMPDESTASSNKGNKK